MIKYISIIAIALLMVPGLSFAGAKEDLAAEVLKFTEIKKMSEQVVSQVLQMQAAQVKQIVIPAERKSEETVLHDRIHKKLTETVNWEKLEAEYLIFLVEVYTEDELKAIVNFCKSSAGQSILKKEPVIMGKIMMMMQTRIQSVLPDIQKMTRDFSESVKKIK